MRDYIRRFIIAGIMALCISLLFIGGKNIQASTDGGINLEYNGKLPNFLSLRA